MKPLFSILAAALLLGTAVPAAKAAPGLSINFFHDNLESYGEWREVGDYGYCWQPRDVASDWRPYSDGRWLYTDAGWTWDSEEPYAWAVYHYGRWARVDQIGWVWVPGTEWGPAWVSWRRSPGYVGWAPLPPEAEFNRSGGFNDRVDADYDIGPTNYSFVEVRNFGAPRLRTVIVEPRQNITIILQTTNITRISYVNNVVFNGGPQYDVISRESTQPIRRMKLERREEFNGDAGQLRTSMEGNSLRVMAIPFEQAPATAPRKVAAKVEKAQVDHGWQNAGPPAEVAKLRTRIKNEPAATTAEPLQPGMEKSPGSTGSTPSATPLKEKAEKNFRQPAPLNPVNPEAVPMPSAKPMKHANKENQATPGSLNPQLAPATPVTQEPVKAKKQKNQIVMPAETPPPASVEPVQKKNHAEAANAPGNPGNERNAPVKPESQSKVKTNESHQQAAPANPQPEKGKEKKKHEKTDAANPEATPQ